MGFTLPEVNLCNPDSRATKAKAAPIPVLLTNATTMTLPVEIRTFGTVEPMSTVAVKSQITGILSHVLFSEGQEVKEGDLLFVIDPRPAEATLRQAEAAKLNTIDGMIAVLTTRIDLYQKDGSLLARRKLAVPD